MSTVKVLADANGCIIHVSKNNPEYGYIRVEQLAFTINDRGWLRNSKRSALIKGKVEDLKAANYSEGQELPGKIVVIESFLPFNAENPDKDLKVAGDTGVICRVDDQPIYRNAFYTTNPTAHDELIMHTNADEIREVQAAQKAINGLDRKSATVEL